MCLAWRGYFGEIDIIIKVENFGIVSRMSNYKLNLENGWIRETLENIDFSMSLDQEGAFFNLYLQ
jgi:hypothetical protein